MVHRRHAIDFVVQYDGFFVLVLFQVTLFGVGGRVLSQLRTHIWKRTLLACCKSDCGLIHLNLRTLPHTQTHLLEHERQPTFDIITELVLIGPVPSLLLSRLREAGSKRVPNRLVEERS